MDNMNINDNVKAAAEKIVPELLPDCDVKRLPTVCSPELFRERLADADDESVIVLADYILSQRNEFLQGAANIAVSEIAKRIKNAETVYAVFDKTLAKIYPNVVSGNAVIFLDESRANRFVEEYNKKSNDKARLVTFKGEQISELFMTLTRFGIEFVEIEPTLCKIRYHQKQLFKTDFDSVSDPAVNFAMLRFLQMQVRNEDPKVMKILERAMLSGIGSAVVACMGMTINGRFEALLITDKRDGSKWIPCFTDTSEIQETYTTIPAIATLLMSSQVVTVNFTELERFMNMEGVAGVVMNIGGFGMRLTRQTCRMIISAVKRSRAENQQGENNDNI